MAEELDPVDVVTVGVGWTGGIIAKELAQADYDVVGLERGGERSTEDWLTVHDELGYAMRYKLMQDLSRETITFRHEPEDTALPMRRYGAFLPGTGVGGAGVHWNGVTWRFLPYDFEIESETIEEYGEEAIPDEMQLQDWGITYEELEPYFDEFEYTAGISGVAGNIDGEIQDNGNPYEGPRSRDYPLPPMMQSPPLEVFAEGADAAGYEPFMQPSANLSETYENPDGINLGQCEYCGYCERFGCEWGAKSDPTVTVLPAAEDTGNFELRTHSNVVELLYDEDEEEVTGVKYVDSRTNTVYEQPADVVALTAYVLNNVRLLLLSGIGEPYDPETGEGTVGKNYCYQNMGGSATGFFEDEEWNLYMGAGALGAAFDDINGDNFDHEDEEFLHGGSVSISQTGERPIANNPVPEDTPSWGSEFKEESLEYNHSSLSISCQGAVLPYQDNYLDLDPNYTDDYGLPLIRMTFNWHDQDYALAEYASDVCEEVMEEMGADQVDASGGLEGDFDIIPYQTTHNTGGAIMGADPDESVVNNYLQCWDAHNLFVPGASAFAHNSGYNPTGTVGALAFRAAEGIEEYLEEPEVLADPET
ncbi:gluconate 2-dehydrogenase alpha chain [Natronorubrum sediminis]|uniref:Gluconate 2-dehydrogenase alpha chain n=1 Tax=Natronorubrum sediminis TaxID=640943 RepID=A0A1H6FQ74_9EURY|nr:GMC family oxidoreductase [Natronorubrum sediminis]SEH11905.1 gluconate 2-dehydrogenase alpha chain [Natronorubrum sediminis]